MRYYFRIIIHFTLAHLLYLKILVVTNSHIEFVLCVQNICTLFVAVNAHFKYFHEHTTRDQTSNPHQFFYYRKWCEFLEKDAQVEVSIEFLK